MKLGLTGCEKLQCRLGARLDPLLSDHMVPRISWFLTASTEDKSLASTRLPNEQASIVCLCTFVHKGIVALRGEFLAEVDSASLQRYWHQQQPPL
eukprot:2221966-Amphidinium_carterae.1